MTTKRSIRLAASLFFMVVFLELIGEYAIELAEYTRLVLIVKPLLMPALALYMLAALHNKKISLFYKLIFGALFFSWLGDIFLLVAWSGDQMFLFGLAAFLIAHLLYIPAFRMVPEKQEKSLLAEKPIAAIPVMLYFAGLIYTLYVNGSSEFLEMQLPVILYALVIMNMVLMALNRKNRVAELSYSLVFSGALLFMFSDSLIAVNKFSGALEGSPLLTRILIMATYAIGQYLIVEGCLQQEGNAHSG
ncbi:MAG: lysoplasmalogenase [Bacteroidetes bacterium]|nr:lysoplasmalogenase [Bacteroidota bacterium]